MISDFKTTFLGPGERILDLVPRAGVTDLRELGLNERQIEALRLMVNEGTGTTDYTDYTDLPYGHDDTDTPLGHT